MAKIEYTALVSRIAGRLSHGILSRNKAAAIITRHSAGGHLHRTVKQQLARGTFSDLKSQWYALSPSQKLLWRSFASSSGGAGSGPNAFVEHNIRLLYSGHADLAQINTPPPYPSTPPHVQGFLASLVGSLTTITWSAPTSTTAYVQVFFAFQVGFCFATKAKWSLVQTVRADVGQLVHSHDFPVDVPLFYRARSLDTYGRVSPYTVRTSTTPAPPVTYTYALLIDNSGNANTLADYQVKLTVPADSAVYDHAQNDGGNIRFFDADDTTPLPYWTESWNFGGVSVFWIKVPSIPGSSTKNIYLRVLEPPQTTTSSAENTFILYDGFSGDTIDATKWIERAAGLHVASGHLVFTYTGAQRGHIDSIITFPYPAICETRWYASTEVSAGSHPGVLRESNNWANRVDYYGSTRGSRLSFVSGKNGVYTTTSEVLVGNISLYHIYKEIWELNKRRFFQDDSLKLQHTTNVPIVNMCVSFLELDTSTDPLYVDWVRVRAFAEPEPTAAIIYP